MSSKRNHRIRSRKTFALRMKQAKHYLNGYHPKARSQGLDLGGVPVKK